MLAARSILVNILLLLFVDGVYGEVSLISKNEVENLHSENSSGLQKNHSFGLNAKIDPYSVRGMQVANEFWKLWKNASRYENRSKINDLLDIEFWLEGCFTNVFTKDQFVEFAIEIKMDDPNALWHSTVVRAWNEYKREGWIRFIPNSRPEIEFLLAPQGYLDSGRFTATVCDKQRKLLSMAGDFMVIMKNAIQSGVTHVSGLFQDDFQLECGDIERKEELIWYNLAFMARDGNRISFEIKTPIKDLKSSIRFLVKFNYGEPRDWILYYQFVLNKTSKRLESGKCLDHDSFSMSPFDCDYFD